MDTPHLRMEPELEGGGFTWWFVCPECHGYLPKRSLKCLHCGAEIDWSAYNIKDKEKKHGRVYQRS